MNTKDFTYLLNKPYTLTERQTLELEAVLSEFPYLQCARAIHLKGLYNRDSYRYNPELKKTAAYTTDRSVLFDFITTEQFQSIQKSFFEEKEKSLGLISVTGAEEVTPVTPANKLEESIKLSIKAVEAPEKEMPEVQQQEAETAVQENTAVDNKQPEEKLELGKPLAFTPGEKHSFREWLQLSKLTPVNREPETVPTEDKGADANEEEKSRKLELIDRFIETNPKIVPSKTAPAPPAGIEKNTQDTSYLMTETLARVYLEQKKYTKAIQAYEILILKYPEKSVFFADRISEIKVLQQNNN